jgi:hypothetical protein
VADPPIGQGRAAAIPNSGRKYPLSPCFSSRIEDPSNGVRVLCGSGGELQLRFEEEDDTCVEQPVRLDGLAGLAQFKC